MISTVTWAVVMVGLVLLALIGRDAWLRTLESRHRARTVQESERIHTTQVAMGNRLDRVEGTLKEHHDRIVHQERKQTVTRR